MLTKEQWEILDHTLHRAAKNAYCGNSPAMQDLVDKGLMKRLGRVSWVPDEYFTITEHGREYYKQEKK